MTLYEHSQKMIKKFEKIVNKKAILIILMFTISTSGWIFGISNISLAETTKPFDHSTCQYPNRLSNPVDGCDNTDPACPAEMKGGTCENYQPTEEELAPYVPPATEKVIEPIKKEKTCE